MMAEITDVKIKEEIYSILQQARDMNKRVSREQVRKLIVERFDLPINDRTFRDIYTDMVMDGYPVGSSSTNGYFIVDSQDKYNESVNDIKSKIFSMFKRIKQLQQNVEGTFGNNIQLILELGKE